MKAKTPPSNVDFLEQIGMFNQARSVKSEFASLVADHDRHWRGKDWSDATGPATDSFWIYKTAECIGWWRELQIEIERSYRKQRGSRTARALVWRAVAELSNFYRGAWIAEVVAAGVLTTDLSPETHAVVFDLLHRLEALHATNRLKRITTAALRAELLEICETALAHYDRLIGALAPPVRDEWRRSIDGRSEHFDETLAHIIYG
jgi:hypothetical protein